MYLLFINFLDKALIDVSEKHFTAKISVVELNPIPFEPKIWHLVGIDLIGPF